MTKIHFHEQDLPEGVAFGDAVAIDTETMGLNPSRDRLCLVQLSAGDGTAHLVRFDGQTWQAPRLKAVLESPEVVKIFHYARFDLAMLRSWLGVDCRPVWCTKVASKLVRTYTDKHGLKDLCSEILGVSLNKREQTSDWGAPELNKEQREYAANDVLHLHRLRDTLTVMLEREERLALAQTCFDFLPTRAELDLLDFSPSQGSDIFSH